MSWMSKLYETYENNKGKQLDLPVMAHMQARAQIEIVLDMYGAFKAASIVPKSEPKILIPVTEDSAGRSSGVAPHPLYDTLSYCAGDYEQYIKEGKQTTKKKYEAYIKQLQNWDESEYRNEKEHAIYLYIKQKHMLNDLISAGIIQLDEEGFLSENKIEGVIYEKALVRFIILTNDFTSQKAWEDRQLMDSYTKYYLSVRTGIQSICQITGEKTIITVNHPKGIVSSDYGAKIISANDTVNFTFRGRFVSANEACSIGYEASQKIHNALSWLVATEGVTIGKKEKRTFICWNPKGKKVPQFDDPFTELYLSETNAEVEVSYRRKLYRAIQGQAQELQDLDEVVIMGLDAATTGRLSITYYNELQYSDFLERLLSWKTSCCWYFQKYSVDTGKYEPVVKTPDAKAIIRYAFGTLQGRFVEVNDKVLKQQTDRIYHCILDGARIPRDIVRAITIKASNPQAYDDGIYENLLSTACAVIKKLREEEGEWKLMEEEWKDITERSFLFGRLLAIADYAEKFAMDFKMNRSTNATRLQPAFVNRPFATWKVVMDQLNPYLRRMNPGKNDYISKMIEDIVQTLYKEVDPSYMNKPLNENYLLGYYLQRKDLRTKKEVSNDKKEEV